MWQVSRGLYNNPTNLLALKNKKATLFPPENSSFSIRLIDGQRDAQLPSQYDSIWGLQPAEHLTQLSLLSEFSEKQYTSSPLLPISAVPSTSVGTAKEGPWKLSFRKWKLKSSRQSLAFKQCLKFQFYETQKMVGMVPSINKCTNLINLYSYLNKIKKNSHILPKSHFFLSVNKFVFTSYKITGTEDMESQWWTKMETILAFTEFTE